MRLLESASLGIRDVAEAGVGVEELIEAGAVGEGVTAAQTGSQVLVVRAANGLRMCAAPLRSISGPSPPRRRRPCATWRSGQSIAQG